MDRPTSDDKLHLCLKYFLANDARKTKQLGGPVTGITQVITNIQVTRINFLPKITNIDKGFPGH
jgi:hypothetical protein